MLERTLTCTMGATAAIADIANMLLCRRRHGRARAGRLCVELGVRVARKPLRFFFFDVAAESFLFFRKEREISIFCPSSKPGGTVWSLDQTLGRRCSKGEILPRLRPRLSSSSERREVPSLALLGHKVRALVARAQTQEGSNGSAHRRAQDVRRRHHHCGECPWYRERHGDAPTSRLMNDCSDGVQSNPPPPVQNVFAKKPKYPSNPSNPYPRHLSPCAAGWPCGSWARQGWPSERPGDAHVRGARLRPPRHRRQGGTYIHPPATAKFWKSFLAKSFFCKIDREKGKPPPLSIS